MTAATRLLLTTLICSLLVFEGCRGITPVTIPAETLTVTSTLMPVAPTIISPAGGVTRFNEALPVTLLRGGMLTSTNWSGYTFPVTNVTGVQAEWNEPGILEGENAQVCVWVGVGGNGASRENLIQIGTLAYIDQNGAARHVVWYETIPPNQWFWLGDIGAGDQVLASVELESGPTQNWRLALTDLTTGESFGLDVPYQSLGTDADFIVEDPYADVLDTTLYLPLPRFENITFHNISIRLASSQPLRNIIKGVQINMARGQELLASTGTLEHNTFTVTREGPGAPQA
jgi:hypothetical protein